MIAETRWKQRFENLTKAFRLLEEAATAQNLSALESEGLIQRCEYTFELSWKTLKDYLESKGIAVQFPRDVIKEAFQAGVVGDGEAWIEMLEKRNTLAHTYNETQFKDSVSAVRDRFYPRIRKLVDRLKEEL
jgi:nucleotidyltransferase substrate binding protein (TIGR01987 family)